MSHSLSPLHGNLQDLRFPRILATLERDGFTGVIQVTTPAGDTEPDGQPSTTTREVHLSDGHIAWAISTDKQESLRAFLEKGRTITDAQWNAAEERAREGSLREALTGLGLVKPAELSEIEASRAEAIVLELFSVPEGEYRVRERQLSPGTPDLEIAVSPLLLKGLPERIDRDFALDEVGSLDTVFSLRKDADPAGLPGEYSAIVERLDGKRSIAQLCSDTGLPDNYVLSLVAGLSLAGVLQPADGAPARQAAIPRAEPEPVIEETPETVPETIVAIDADGDRDEVLEDEEVVADAIEVIEEEPIAVAADAEELELVPEDEDTDAGDLLEDAGGEEETIDERFEEPFEEPIEEIRASIYGEGGRDAGTRRWFLIGAAAAVGFAALLFILASQNSGDAGELSTLASPPSTPIAQDAAEEPAPARTSPAARDEDPEEPDSAPPEPATPPPAPREETRPAVAAGTGSPILSPRGREAEAGGAPDRAGATRSTVPPGEFTIKLLTACQEGTVERAIARAGNARELFMLPARIGGRSCQRLYWGGYATREQAQRALRREVPAFFRSDRNPPAIVTMP